MTIKSSNGYRVNGSNGSAETARPTAGTLPATGLVIAGAAGKGPFAAGALSIIADQDSYLNIRNVVGASSGALNAAVFAAGLAADKPVEAAARLERLWRYEATWSQILSHAQRIRIVEQALRGFAASPKRKVMLRLSVASLSGETRPLSATGKDPNKIYPHDPTGAPHTRYEETYTFSERDLADEGQHNKIAEVAVASAAIPVLFRPESISGKGPYVDGGLVNNAPISLAIRDHDAIDRVIVVTPEPAVVPARACLGRFSVRTLFEIMVNERLARDLYEAQRLNDKLAKLREVVAEDTVKTATGWRHLEIIEVRPSARTPGGIVSGFFSSTQRDRNIRLGRDAARAALQRPPSVVSASKGKEGDAWARPQAQSEPKQSDAPTRAVSQGAREISM